MQVVQHVWNRMKVDEKEIVTTQGCSFLSVLFNLFSVNTISEWRSEIKNRILLKQNF